MLGYLLHRERCIVQCHDFVVTSAVGLQHRINLRENIRMMSFLFRMIVHMCFNKRLHEHFFLYLQPKNIVNIFICNVHSDRTYWAYRIPAATLCAQGEEPVLNFLHPSNYQVYCMPVIWRNYNYVCTTTCFNVLGFFKHSHKSFIIWYSGNQLLCYKLSLTYALLYNYFYYE